MLDLTGQTFGFWKIIGRSARQAGDARVAYWDCECACGKKRRIRSQNLRRGSRSCGCYRTTLTPEQLKENRAAYNKRPEVKARKYAGIYKRQRERYKTDTEYRLKIILRIRVKRAVIGDSKAGSAVRDLGCSIAEFKVYIEEQFLPGMTWDNWSPSGWHLDHIRPLASFDLTDREQFLQACHYTNYQPLWAVDNLRKSARQS